jgi:hypothetical protein
MWLGKPLFSPRQGRRPWHAVQILALGLPARVQVWRQEPSRGAVLGLIRIRGAWRQFSLVFRVYSNAWCYTEYLPEIKQKFSGQAQCKVGWCQPHPTLAAGLVLQLQILQLPVPWSRAPILDLSNTMHNPLHKEATDSKHTKTGMVMCADFATSRCDFGDWPQCSRHSQVGCAHARRRCMPCLCQAGSQ